MSEWLDVDGAARYLRVEVSFIRRLVLERRVAYHKLGKYLRFKPVDLDALVEDNRVESEVIVPVGRSQQISNSHLLTGARRRAPRSTKEQ